MTKRIPTSLLSLCALMTLADRNLPQVQFQYDAAGNRISRQLAQPRLFQSPVLQQTTFNVYPTIVSDIINITTQDEIVPDEFSYTITNVSGNIVLSGNVLSQNTQLQVTLPQGYYILNIFSASEQYSFHFLKN